jgi:hypothetical protein
VVKPGERAFRPVALVSAAVTVAVAIRELDQLRVHHRLAGAVRAVPSLLSVTMRVPPSCRQRRWKAHGYCGHASDQPGARWRNRQ